MHHILATLGLVAAVMAAPQPEVARAVKARQVGGGLGGFVPGASGTLTGIVPASGVPSGCIGGVITGKGGETICAREAEVARAVKARVAFGTVSGSVPASVGSSVASSIVPVKTPPPGITAAPSQTGVVGGGLGGFVPGLSGTLSGFVPSSGIPFGCIGGAISGHGVTICARATDAPELEERQVGGGLGGFVPGLDGTLSGFVPGSTGIPEGCIGGAISGKGITLCARFAEPTPAVEARQVGGGLGGFVPGASGALSGTVPAEGDPFGCIGGLLGNGEGATACAKKRTPVETGLAQAN